MAHVALRLGIRALCRSRIVSGNLSYNIIMAKSSTLRALNPLSSFRFYSNGGELAPTVACVNFQYNELM